MSKTTYEGARMASTWPDLIDRTLTVDANNIRDEEELISAIETNATSNIEYLEIQNRIGALIAAHQNSFISENIMAEVERINVSANNSFIRVTLMTFHPIQFQILPFMNQWFSSVPIRTTHEVPYLLNT